MPVPNPRPLPVALLLLAASTAAVPAAAQGCAPSGMSGQCNELGSILMDFQRDIAGQPIDQNVRITIGHDYREVARSFLFSVRNLSQEGTPSPVSVALVSFATASGDVTVLKTEQPTPSQLDLWVDVLDVPVGDPIDLTVSVGARERGAFRLEALVMPFDRGYAPLTDAAGNSLNLFAFTVLGVNKASGEASSGNPGGLFKGSSVGKALPGPEAWVLAASVGLAALATSRTLYRRP